jgi:hypothetical protein
MVTTNSMNKTNRRRSPRRDPRSYVKVECRIGPCGLGPNLATATLDISDTGIRLIVKQASQVPGDAEITIAGHGLQATIKRQGHVRWQVPLADGQFCIGVEFDKRLNYRDWQTLASPS